MNYFESISQEKLSQLIAKTDNSLFLSLPFLHREMTDAIKQLSNKKRPDGKKINIQILIDFDAQTIRQGYGELGPVRELINENFNIKSMDDNRISFIISDDIGYYLFMESRSLIPADKSTINAVKIDSVSIVRLKHYFFPSTKQEELKDELSDAIIEESQQLENAEQIMQKEKAPAKEITREKFENVTADIESNPPIRPDYERRVKIYATRFQYVELQLKGGGFKQHEIKLPDKLLPHSNEELKRRLQARLKLFDQLKKTDAYKHFKEIEKKKEDMAKRYLTQLKCRPNQRILRKEEKEYLQKEIEQLNTKLNEVIQELYGEMINDIKYVKEELKETLYDFMLNNPTREMINLGEENKELMARDRAARIIDSFKMPDPYSQWLKNLRIEAYYSDITYEDLGREELLEELYEKGLIDEEDENNLADFSKGIKYSEGQSE